jgi:hypothetical protein
VPRPLLDYVEILTNRFPGLRKANLRPVPRELSGSGLYDESLRTGGGRYSFEADFEGRTIQLDDITLEGEIVDIKMRDTGRTIGREPQWAPSAGEKVPRDVYDVISAAVFPSSLTERYRDNPREVWTPVGQAGSVCEQERPQWCGVADQCRLDS